MPSFFGGERVTPLLQVKTLTNETNDSLINLLIERTQAELLEITHFEEYDAVLDNVLVDMVIVKLNRKGNEGLNSFSGSGMSENYLDEYPEHIRRQLRKYTHRVVVK
jgi:hypothetical protein